MPWRCELLRSALETGCWRPEGGRQRQHVWVDLARFWPSPIVLEGFHTPVQ